MTEHEKMRQRAFKISDTDWQTTKALARREGVTVGTFINMLIKGYAVQHGFKWQGGLKRGRPRKDK